MKNKMLFASLVLTEMTACAIMPSVTVAPSNSKPPRNYSKKRSKVTGFSEDGEGELIKTAD